MPVLLSWLLVLLLMASASACDRREVVLDQEGSGEAAYRIHQVTERDEEGTWLRVEVEPLPPYRVNLEFPWAVAVPALDTEQRNADAARLDEQRAVFRVPVDAFDRDMIEGNMRLSVCTDDICLTPRERLRWELAEGE